MPVVNLKSDLFQSVSDPTGPAPKPELCRGRPIIATFNATNGATDSQNSTYLLCEVPSDAIIDSRTMFKVDLWGFAQIAIGTLTNPTALVNQTRATGATVTPFVAGDAKHGMPFWQALGMTEDPRGMIGIYAHGALANATGAGSMRGEIHYKYR